MCPERELNVIEKEKIVYVDRPVPISANEVNDNGIEVKGLLGEETAHRSNEAL